MPSEIQRSADATDTCVYCGTIFHGDNHKTRFLRRMKKTKKIQKILARQDAGQHLSKFHLRMAQLFQQSKTRKVGA